MNVKFDSRVPAHRRTPIDVGARRRRHCSPCEPPFPWQIAADITPGRQTCGHHCRHPGLWFRRISWAVKQIPKPRFDLRSRRGGAKPSRFASFAPDQTEER